MTKCVLIIDDDRSVRDSLKRVLQEAGYTVVLATDGQEGVASLDQHAVDLLLLDLNLPKVSGFDILDLTTEQHPSLPVIILTGQLDQCEPGALAGADALVEKPPDVDRLLELVKELLSEPAEARLRRLGDGLTAARTRAPIEAGPLRLQTPPAGFRTGFKPVIRFRPSR